MARASEDTPVPLAPVMWMRRDKAPQAPVPIGQVTPVPPTPQ